METSLVHKNKTLSFYQLLNQEKKIEIPIIQRDYAQGRIDKEELRNTFLTALYDAIYSEIPIKLDFIYGSKVEMDFQPLDGQQRLTTLFLLHWYAASKDNVEYTEKTILKKFSYETRITSREFCNSLIDNNIKIEKETKLSSLIKDSKWFFLSWKHDPTIDSMLRTIDDIHLKFFQIENLWTKLNEKNLITFYYIELENIGLTDDLYIKMNARGKLLSPFENFKASFEKTINQNQWEEGLTETDRFAFKIDTKWTDFFWKHFKKDNKIDDALMRFMSTIAMIRLSLEKSQSRIANIQSTHDNPNKLKPSIISEDTFKYLCNCFEIYSNWEDLNSLNCDFPFWRHTPEKSIIQDIVYEDKNISYTQKVLFYAQTEYLLNNEDFHSEKFNDWMRVIRNIVSRGNIVKGGKRPDIIRSPETFDGVINLVFELSQGCNDIYKYLSETNKLNSSFAKEQIEEEKAKAKLILKYPEYRKNILKMEDNSLLKGRIEFVFDCIDYNYDVTNFNITLFDKVQDIIGKYFYDDNTDTISNDIRRALLTIEDGGKYEFYGYWWSYWNVGDATKRCLIENYRELEYYIYYTEYRNYMKNLFKKLFIKDLEFLIESFVPPTNMPTWKVRLIKENSLLNKHNKSNFIGIPNDESCCYLLASKRPRDLEGSFTVE